MIRGLYPPDPQVFPETASTCEIALPPPRGSGLFGHFWPQSPRSSPRDFGNWGIAESESVSPGAGAGEKRGEGCGGLGFDGGEPGGERQLVDTGVGVQAGEFGEQRGVGEDRWGEKAGGGFAGGRVAVVPAVYGQGAGEPGVDVGLDVAAGAAGELVAYGLVALSGLGLVQGAELAQRLELVGAGRDPHRFAQLGSAAAAAASAASSARTTSSVSGS